MNSWRILKEGDKIEILNDFFIIDFFENCKKFRKIKLKTNDPDIFSAEIHYYNENEIYFKIERKLDIKIKGKGFTYNNHKYQIINEKKIETFENGAWNLKTILLLNKLNSNKGINQKIKVVKNEKDESIFYDYEKIETNQILFNPVEDFTKDKEPIIKKIKIKIKDPIV